MLKNDELLNRLSRTLSQPVMRITKVVVPWEEGLHLRPAAKLVRTARYFRSRIFLKRGGKIADVRSILSVLSLCATMGMTLDLEATGEDEHAAARAVEQVFSLQTAADSLDAVTPLAGSSKR
jgi:phosphocarrier protein HPr